MPCPADSRTTLPAQVQAEDHHNHRRPPRLRKMAWKLGRASQQPLRPVGMHRQVGQTTSELCRFRKGGQFWKRRDNGLSSSSLFGQASSPTTNAEKQAKEIHPDPDNPRLLSSPNAVGRRSDLSVHRTLAAHLLRRGAPKRILTKDELYSIYAITNINLGPLESTSPCTVLKSSKGLPRGGQATLTGLEEQTKNSDDHPG